MRTALVVRAAAAAAVALGVAKGILSCVDLESLGNGVRALETGTGAPEGGSEADAADPCAHAAPVGAPDVDDDPTTELPTFVLALESVSLDTDQITSFDLDGVCTCDSRQGTAEDGGATCAAAKVTCDLDGGADNALAMVAKEARPILAVDGVPNALIRAGRRTLLVQIRRYNGRANDREVAVGAFVSEGIRTQGCPDSGYDTRTETWSPGACGDDAWTLAPSAIFAQTGGETFANVVGTGYVRDFRLVVRLSRPAILPFNADSTIAFHGALLAGRLVGLHEDLSPRDASQPPAGKEQRLFRLEEGVLAGRVGASDLIATVGSYQASAGGTRLCVTTAFPTVRETLCDAVDILRSPPNGGGACDSLSGAFGFKAGPALAGNIADAAVTATGCESLDAAALRCR